MDTKWVIESLRKMANDIESGVDYPVEAQLDHGLKDWEENGIKYKGRDGSRTLLVRVKRLGNVTPEWHPQMDSRHRDHEDSGPTITISRKDFEALANACEKDAEASQALCRAMAGRRLKKSQG